MPVVPVPTAPVMRLISAAYDSAVENDINKSSPLPKKKDGTVEREIELIFEMKDLPK